MVQTLLATAHAPEQTSHLHHDEIADQRAIDAETVHVLSNSDPAVKARAVCAMLDPMDNVPAPRPARFRASGVDLMAIVTWLDTLAALSRIPVLSHTGYAQLFRSRSAADLTQPVTGLSPATLYLAVGTAGATHATRGNMRRG